MIATEFKIIQNMKFLRQYFKKPSVRFEHMSFLESFIYPLSKKLNFSLAETLTIAAAS